MNWVGRSAPNFNLPNLFKPSERFDQSLLNMPRLIHVFSTWCKACESEHHILLDKAKDFKDYFLGINFYDEPDLSREWLNKFGNPYTLVLLDDQNQFALDYGVVAPPETLVIKAGKICFRQAGPITLEVWDQKIAPCLSNH